MIDRERVSTNVLAEILGVTRETIRLRNKDGTLSAVSRGKYNLAEAVQAYISYCENGHQSGEAASVRQDVDYQRARKLKLENDRVEGRTLDVDEVHAVFAEAMILIRQRLVALPSRNDAELAGTSDRAEVRDIIEREVNATLANVAEGLQNMAGDNAANSSGTTSDQEDPGGMG